VRLNFSSMVFNCLANSSLVVSLASKRPIVTWCGFQFAKRKFITRAKVYYYPLFIHKSNVVIIIGVALNKGETCKFKQCVTMFGRILVDNVFWEGKTTLGSIFKANFYIHKFSHVLKGKNPLAINNIESSKNNFWISSCFL